MSPRVAGPAATGKPQRGTWPRRGGSSWLEPGPRGPPGTRTVPPRAQPVPRLRPRRTEKAFVVQAAGGEAGARLRSAPWSRVRSRFFGVGGQVSTRSTLQLRNPGKLGYSLGGAHPRCIVIVASMSQWSSLPWEPRLLRCFARGRNDVLPGGPAVLRGASAQSRVGEHPPHLHPVGGGSSSTSTHTLVARALATWEAGACSQWVMGPTQGRWQWCGHQRSGTVVLEHWEAPKVARPRL